MEYALPQHYGTGHAAAPDRNRHSLTASDYEASRCNRPQVCKDGRPA